MVPFWARCGRLVPCVPLLVLGGEAPARAADVEGPPRNGTADSGTVVVLAVPDAAFGPDAPYRRAIEAHMAASRAHLVVVAAGPVPDTLSAWARRARDLARRHGAAGVFWVEPGADEALVYLAEPGAEKILVRRVERGGQSEAALADAVGLVVQVAAEALAEGRTIGMVSAEEAVRSDEREEPPTAKAPPAAGRREPPAGTSGPSAPAGGAVRSPNPGVRTDRPPAAAVRVDLAVGYLGANFADEVPWQSGVVGRVHVVPLRRLRVGLAYGYGAPGWVRTPWVDVSLSRHELRAHAGIAMVARRGGELWGDATVGLDLVVRRSRAGALPPAPTTVRPVAVLGGRVCGAVRLWSGGFLYAGVGLSVPTRRFRYYVELPPEGEGEPGREQVALMAPVRGVAEMGLAVRFDALPGRRKRHRERAAADDSFTPSARGAAP